MKSIKQIFKDNPDLMEISEVRELIEYCIELEGKVIENIQTKQFSFEDKLAELVRDINNGIKDVEKQKEEHIRFNFEPPNYAFCIENLKKYLSDFSRVNRFRL
jgi:tRNA uridine 5-carbamoylmethylation protein Kti12